MTLDSPDIITEIISGEHDASLDVIRAAIKQREKIMGDINLLTLMPGTRVRLKGLSPKYLNGELGTIMDVTRRGKRIHVSLDKSMPRFGKTINPPASCVEAIK